MEKQELQKKFERPFIDGKVIKEVLTNVLEVSDSKARSIYHAMREKYTNEATEKSVIVFGTQIPTDFALNYLAAIGISKEYIFSHTKN